jgi:xylulose-5-phosphate/fructose-6-phosphate phosphoketolase
MTTLATTPPVMTGSLDATRLRQVDALWRAANYLSVGQIYLLDNPLLREPLRPDQIKPRLLGHWGTSPGRQRGGAVPGVAVAAAGAELSDAHLVHR